MLKRPDSALTKAVAAPTTPLPDLGPPPGWDRSYAHFRFGIIHRILAGGLQPAQVAVMLGEAADRYHQITYEECRRLRQMGDVWQPWSGPPLPEATVAAVRARMAPRSAHESRAYVLETEVPPPSE